jgi:tyrosine-protein phosphatase SIW14
LAPPIVSHGPLAGALGWLRWAPVLALFLFVTATPIVFYRYVYTQNKRLREVAPGKVYRSGQMSVDGFTTAIRLYGLRTIINFQDEYPDPDLPLTPWSWTTIKESELCRQLGVRYLWMPPDLIARRCIPAERPRTLDRFLKLMDDPATYPVLLHCRAGLHRTGVMVAAYRMEYEGWSQGQALEELRDNGFTLWQSTSANDYITQYILTFRRGIRH